MNKKWWIIGGLIVVGAGVGAYFLFRPKKEKGGSDGQSTNNDESTNKISNSSSSSSSSSSLSSSSSSSSSSTIKCTGSYPSTPFSSKAEGDAFRKWVNDNYSTYAKEIDLSLSGEYNNCYIKKAYDKYGKVYSFALVPTYIGAGATKSGDLYFVDSGGTQFRFYNNGRFAYGSGSATKKGSYALGGRIMKGDNGAKASSGSVYQNMSKIKEYK